MKPPVAAGRKRCAWAEATPELRDYHDHEYGLPVAGDREYLERMILEIFQAGLSWRTILAKRASFRRAFSGFRPEKIAAFTRADVQKLLCDAAIIRNRRKIEAAVANASVFLHLQKKHGSFRRFLQTLPLDHPAETVKIFKRTFSFMGPKIVGEFLMSTGHWPVQHDRECYLRNRAGAVKPAPSLRRPRRACGRSSAAGRCGKSAGHESAK